MVQFFDYTNLSELHELYFSPKNPFVCERFFAEIDQ